MPCTHASRAIRPLSIAASTGLVRERFIQQNGEAWHQCLILAPAFHVLVFQERILVPWLTPHDFGASKDDHHVRSQCIRDVSLSHSFKYLFTLLRVLQQSVASQAVRNLALVRGHSQSLNTTSYPVSFVLRDGLKIKNGRVSAM
jgi:hypothetical protein